MTDPWERRASATGRRLHWARPTQKYALCGSAVVDGLAEAAGSECESCARKFAKLRAIAAAKQPRT